MPFYLCAALFEFRSALLNEMLSRQLLSSSSIGQETSISLSEFKVSRKSWHLSSLNEKARVERGYVDKNLRRTSKTTSFVTDALGQSKRLGLFDLKPQRHRILKKRRHIVGRNDDKVARAWSLEISHFV